MKKLICLCMSVLLLFSFSTSAIAEETTITKDSFAPIIDYDSATVKENGDKVYDVKNKQEVADFLGIEYSEIKDITVTIPKKDNASLQRKIASSSQEYDALASSYYITDIVGPSGSCGSTKIAQNSAYNGSKYTIEKEIILTGTLENTFSTNLDAGISLGAAEVSSSVGFDVTRSWAASDKTTVTLEPYERITVLGFPLYDNYNFKVYKSKLFGDDEFVGRGVASEAVGFCTVTK